MSFIKDLMISAMLTLNTFLSPQTRGLLEDSAVLVPEEEAKRIEDEWDRLMHLDDVTLDEEEMLCSDDPEQILQAQQQIEERQKEFQGIWDDKEYRKQLFQEAYLKDADLEREQVPMEQREGWEDDEDMPETFIGIDEVSGELHEIRFDQLDEWRNK